MCKLSETLTKCGAGALAREKLAIVHDHRPANVLGIAFFRKCVFYMTPVLGMSALLFVSITSLAQSPNEQLPAGAAKEKAEAACLTCHEARIIVQQRLSQAAWAKEVDKMTKWGAEVDPKDRDELIEYLSSNFGPNQPAYVAPRSANQSNSKGRAKH